MIRSVGVVHLFREEGLGEEGREGGKQGGGIKGRVGTVGLPSQLVPPALPPTLPSFLLPSHPPSLPPSSQADLHYR
jgi:hypothetical protein